MRTTGLTLVALLLTVVLPMRSFAGPSNVAEAYFELALKLLREKHINSARADWTQLETRARAKLGDARTTADTYPAIRFLVHELGEKHSFLMEPRAPVATGAADSAKGGPASEPSLPSWQLIDGRFGRVSLPSLDTIGGGREAIGPIYSRELTSALRRMDATPLCGWIVDLRENGGGNMWPMLQGLDPLLGNAPFGYFVTQSGSTVPWVRTPGGIYPYSDPLGEVKPAYELRQAAAPLAVLIGPKTSSSGEMVAIALAGRLRTRTFGQATAGFATGNAVHPLGDGAFLITTEVTVRDRRSRNYSGPITPDEQIHPNQTEAAAHRWLAAQCGH